MEGQNPAFDASEIEILKQLKPDDDGVIEAPEAGAGEGGDGAAAAAAPAAAAPAPAPAPSADSAAAPAPAVAATVAAGAPAAAPAPVEAHKPQGDMRAALRASRRAEQRLRDETARLREENEQLRKTAPPPASQLTDEEFADLEANFPAMAKIALQQRELANSTQRAAPAPTPAAEFEAPTYDPAIQEQIDQVPELLAWQYDPAQQDKFARATQYDQALQVDPDWQGKSLAERFVEAVRRTHAALGTSAAPAPAPASPSTAPTAPARPDPAAVIAAAPVEGPKGISDFRGGAPANVPSLDYARMSDEQIMASLSQS